MTSSTTLTRERADLIESLRRHRSFLRITVRGLTDKQAGIAATRHWHLTGGETLEGVLADYDAVARHTDEVVATLPDLDADHALPGHADILRESIDGQKTMG